MDRSRPRHGSHQVLATLLTVGIVATVAVTGARTATAEELDFDALALEIEQVWEGQPSSRSGPALPSTVAENVLASRANYVTQGFDVLDATINVEALADGVWEVHTELSLSEAGNVSSAAWSEYFRNDVTTSRSGPRDVSVVSDEEAMAGRGQVSRQPSLDEIGEAWKPAIDPSSDVRPNRIVVEDPAKQEVRPGMKGRTLPALNYIAMRDYALTWSKTSTMSAWYGDAGNNCANFASQVLNAGGWPAHRDYVCSSESMDNWTHKNNALPCVFLSRYSYTWSKAHNQQTWMIERGHKWRLPNIWEARLSDYLYVDWDPNNVPDGKIDHVMVVTGHATTTGEPRISQQSSPRNNILLSESIRIAKSQGKNIIHWFGLIT